MNNQPVVITETKLDNDGSTDAPVQRKLKVTYAFQITSAPKLNLPYAYSVNGVIPDQFKQRARKINCATGKIEIQVSAGESVALFLNSDAHPSYRKSPVYKITPTDRDVLIKIIERSGRRLETDELVEDNNRIVTAEHSSAKNYKGMLTGDIWMKISHKYTAAEVSALISPHFNALITESVKKIYDNLRQPSLNITVSTNGSQSDARCIEITFVDSENARNNIRTGYDLLTEGLPRAHPAGFAAIFNAALTTGINKVRMTSTWRPMMGSIAHRAGLGLDVDFIGSTQLNREKLRGKPKGSRNVSDEEVMLFADLEAAEKKQLAAKKEVNKAQAAVKQANGDTASLIDAKRQLNEAIEASNKADASRKKAEAAWIAERDRNEPAEVKRFRQALISSPSISQLFDPWVMDSNTSDKISPLSNKQNDDNEELHAHHLHITVNEPKIL